MLNDQKTVKAEKLDKLSEQIDENIQRKKKITLQEDQKKMFDIE